MKNFTTFPEVFDIFEFQDWNDFLKISEDIYTGMVPAFCSTLIPSDEDNTSLQSIVRSFKLQVLSSDSTQIINTLNKRIQSKAGVRRWEELGATEEEVATVLTGKRSMHVRDIHISYLLTSIRVVYSVVQHTMLPYDQEKDQLG